MYVCVAEDKTAVTSVPSENKAGVTGTGPGPGPSEDEEDLELIAQLGLFECTFRVTQLRLMLCERFAFGAPNEPKPMLTHLSRLELKARDLEAKVLVRSFDTRVVAALRSLDLRTQYSLPDSPVPENYPFLESAVPSASASASADDKLTLARTDEFAAFIGESTLPLLQFNASALPAEYQVERNDADLHKQNTQNLLSPSPAAAATATAPQTAAQTTPSVPAEAEAKRARLFWVDVRILDRQSPLYKAPEFKQCKVNITAICQELAMHLHQEAFHQLIQFAMHKLAPIFEAAVYAAPSAAPLVLVPSSQKASGSVSEADGSFATPPTGTGTGTGTRASMTASSNAGGRQNEPPKRKRSSLVETVMSVRRLSSSSSVSKPKPKLELKPLLGKGHYAMRVSAQVQSLSIQIANAESGPLARFGVRRISSAVAIADFLTEVSLQLSSISLAELSEAALYKQILAIDPGCVKEKLKQKQADCFFDLHVQVHERERLLSAQERKQILRKEVPKEQLLAVALARNLDYHDVDLKLDVNRVNFIYTQRFINGSLKMLMSTFGALNTESVRATIHEKNAQLYGAARQSLSSFREQEFRLAMDVSIKAPFIFVPSSPNSTHGLGLDMGSISIRNHLEFAPKEPSADSSASQPQRAVPHKKLTLMADTRNGGATSLPVPAAAVTSSSSLFGTSAGSQRVGGESFPKLDVMQVTLSDFKINRMSVYLPCSGSGSGSGTGTGTGENSSDEVVVSLRASVEDSERNVLNTSASTSSMKSSSTNLSLSSSTSTSTRPITRNLVEPVTVSVVLQRNICAAWFHGVPDLHLRVDMPALALSASASDLALLMHTVLFNLDVLSELFPPPPPATKNPLATSSSAGTRAGAAPTSLGAAPADIEDQVVLRKKEYYISIFFVFLFS